MYVSLTAYHKLASFPGPVLLKLRVNHRYYEYTFGSGYKTRYGEVSDVAHSQCVFIDWGSSKEVLWRVHIGRARFYK